MSNIQSVNSRLRTIGAVEVNFTHRDGRRYGVVQILPVSPRSLWFYWRERSAWISVKDYFFVRYGIEIPDGATCVAYVEIAPHELFPMEVSLVEELAPSMLFRKAERQ